jgi:hypothetical protein
MPSIDQLETAIAATDADLLPVSQAGVLKAITRAELVAGLQPTLSLGSGQLLGRIAQGTGAPAAISLGANLVLANNQLSATAAPYSLHALPQGSTPAATDAIGIVQAGTDRIVPYSQFMAGLSRLPALDASNLLASPSGTTTQRRLADHLADSAPIEAFGASGDGVTDDTHALLEAIASGRPVRFGAKTYLIAGPITIATSITLLGQPGQTRLRRNSQLGGTAWITITAPSFHAEGIIFDANRADVPIAAACVSIAPSCTSSDWRRCGFLAAAGDVSNDVNGSGLVIQQSTSALSAHVIDACEFADNAAHGLWAQACCGLRITACRAHDNAATGFALDTQTITQTHTLRLAEISTSSAWSNQRGITIGHASQDGATPSQDGMEAATAIIVQVSHTICHDNTLCGLSAHGPFLFVQHNRVTHNGADNGAGSGTNLIARTAFSRITDNVISGLGAIGLDCAGSFNTDITANTIQGHAIGLNCGGSVNLRVTGNTIQDASEAAIRARLVEAGPHGATSGLLCRSLALTDNWISLTSPAAIGIALQDGPQAVLVARNHFLSTGGALVTNCLHAATDEILIEGNHWTISPRHGLNAEEIGGLQTLVVPDIADAAMVLSAPAGVHAVISASQARLAGQISFIRLTAGGSGYSTASIAIGGSGNGATARAVLSKGAVLGIIVTAGGQLYGQHGASVPITIIGDGSGAAAQGFAGLPVPEERRLRLRCNTPVRFMHAGSSPLQENWTGADILVPGHADIEWIGTFGAWRAASFPHG